MMEDVIIMMDEIKQWWADLDNYFRKAILNAIASGSILSAFCLFLLTIGRGSWYIIPTIFFVMISVFVITIRDGKR